VVSTQGLAAAGINCLCLMSQMSETIAGNAATFSRYSLENRTFSPRILLLKRFYAIMNVEHSL